jgi:CubicO group peptidase (beta-lactamase class C family)
METTASHLIRGAATPWSLCVLAACVLLTAPETATAAGMQTKGHPENQSCLGPSIVDVEDFADRIERRLLNGNVVGFALAISEGGITAASAGGGFARLPLVDSDEDGVAFTATKDMNVFSVSKTITAIATLQLMEALDLEPQDPISDYLPGAWDKGPGFGADGITFEELLTHRTGIEQAIAAQIIDGVELPDTNKWEGLELIVEQGVDSELAATACPTENEDGTWSLGAPEEPEAGYYGVRCYKNANFALARLLIWRMALETGALGPEFAEKGQVNSAPAYQRYVQQNVLHPAGVSGSCYPTGAEALRAMAYDIAQNEVPVMLTGGSTTLGQDGVLSCGPKNWWLSARDLVLIAAELHCGELLSESSRNLMDELKLGWDPGSNEGVNPDRYWHGGAGIWNPVVTQLLWKPENLPGTQAVVQTAPAENRLHTCIAKLPYDIDAALIMNSHLRDDPDTDACDVLLEAFGP